MSDNSPDFTTENGPDCEAPASNGAKIRTLLVDDQSSGLTVLRNILRFEPDIEIIGTASNGPDGIEAINRLAPDLVFLDVQMPGLDGFGVVAGIKSETMPIIVFVTARDDCALKAFEAQALDYVVKPCQASRLHSAVARARQQLHSHQNRDIRQKLDSLIDKLKGETKYPERLAVKSNGRIVFLRIEDLDLVEAADNYVKLYAGKETHLLRETLGTLEDKLPPGRFVRISRSAIVNVESIKELHPLFHGEYSVALKNGSRATLTRGYREQLHQLGVSPALKS
ncbi:MAG TPA: LytTR family DNA-binding domain-containing protein [Verrucomicrobiae bacterium]|nr:LytTR family DNA-binding domain-containing protein [Verrucomicrobiae bacterium]